MTDKTKNTTAAVAGVAGAVVGAGVAVAATKLMTDKKMRDKVAGTLTQVKDQVFEALDQTAVQQKGGSASRKVGSGQQKKLGQSKSNQGNSTAGETQADRSETTT